jgi:hypothetical protein
VPARLAPWCDALALAATRVLQGRGYAVNTRNAATLAASHAVAAAHVVTASPVAAVRALRIAPSQTLRDE